MENITFINKGILHEWFFLSHAYKFCFSAGNRSCHELRGKKKKICSLEPLMLSVGAGKGSGATVSVEKGVSVLNSLVFRSQYKHITGRS